MLSNPDGARPSFCGVSESCDRGCNALLGKGATCPHAVLARTKSARRPASETGHVYVCMHMEGKGIEKHSLARACFRPLMHVKYPTVTRHDFSIML